MTTPTITLSKFKRPDPKHVLQSSSAQLNLTDKQLNIIAYALGLCWIVATALLMGIREGGDSANHMGMAEKMFSNFNLAALYQGRPAQFHMTHFWMGLLGKTGFIAFVALWTAFIPRLVLAVLRNCGVRQSLCLLGVVLASAHPEFYKWAFYVLSDGWFLIQALAFVYVLTRPAIIWPLIPMLGYSVLHSRPTAIFFLPAIFVFAALTPDKRIRYGLSAMAIAASIWSIGLISSGGGNAGLHLDWARGNFVEGYTLEDHNMDIPLAVPFTPEAVSGRSVAAICGDYPGYCAGYFAKKLSRFVWPVFPAYSLRHNLINAIYFGGLIFMSLFALVSIGINRRQVRKDHLSASAALCYTLVLTAAFFHTFIAHIDTDTRNLIVWTLPWLCGTLLALELHLRCRQPVQRHADAHGR